MGFGVSVGFGVLVAVGTGVVVGFVVGVSAGAEGLDAAFAGDELPAGASSSPHAERTTVRMSPRHSDRFIAAGPRTGA